MPIIKSNNKVRSIFKVADDINKTELLVIMSLNSYVRLTIYRRIKPGYIIQFGLKIAIRSMCWNERRSRIVYLFDVCSN